MTRRRRTRALWSLAFAAAYVMAWAILPAIFGARTPMSRFPQKSFQLGETNEDTTVGNRTVGRSHVGAFSDVSAFAQLIDECLTLYMIDFSNSATDRQSLQNILSRSGNDDTRLVENVWQFGWPFRCWYADKGKSYTPVEQTTTNSKSQMGHDHRFNFQPALTWTPFQGSTIVLHTPQQSALPQQQIRPATDWPRGSIPIGPLPLGILLNATSAFLLAFTTLSLIACAQTMSRLRQGHCVFCNYNKANTHRCPECGQSMPKASRLQVRLETQFNRLTMCFFRYRRHAITSLAAAIAFVAAGALLPPLIGVSSVQYGTPLYMMRGPACVARSQSFFAADVSHFDLGMTPFEGPFADDEVFTFDLLPLIGDINTNPSEAELERLHTQRSLLPRLKFHDHATVWRFGWPARAWHTTVVNPLGSLTERHGVTDLIRRAEAPDARAQADSWRRGDLPYKPIPLGIAINGTSAFALCFLGLTLAEARTRRRRLKRGLCENYGYSKFSAPRCPECGHQSASKQTNSQP